VKEESKLKLKLGKFDPKNVKNVKWGDLSPHEQWSFRKAAEYYQGEWAVLRKARDSYPPIWQTHSEPLDDDHVYRLVSAKEIS
jgi:hypothetical protein